MAVELIAEVSSNHGGSLSLAKEFVHAFAEAGADWVKFQTTRVKHLNPADPQYAWFQQAELSYDAHEALIDECRKRKVKFLTTIYNPAEVRLLIALGVRAVKIGSGEANDESLKLGIWEHRTWFDRMFISRGMDHWVQPSVPSSMEMLRCVTAYPAPLSACAQVPYDPHGLEVGWSDHCVGLDACKGAILMGARVIEKHVQLDGQARPSKPYEATTREFYELRRFADDEQPSRFLDRWQFA